MSHPALYLPVGSQEESFENAEVVARLYDAFVEGDVQRTLECFAPDALHHVPGRGLNAGDYWGHAGVTRFMENVRHHYGGLWVISVPVLSVHGDDAFTREILRINRAHDPGRVWTLRIANRFKIRAGKISESWVIPEDQREYDEYWSEPFEPVARPTTIIRHDPAARVVDVERAVSTENTTLLREMYRRFWRNDLGAIRELFAEDVVVNIVGRSELSGIYEGWEGFLEFRNTLMSLAGNKYKLDVVAVAGSANDVWATEHIRMNRAWDPALAELLVQMHFEVQNGKVVRMNDFPFDTYAWESFYTRPSNEVIEGAL